MGRPPRELEVVQFEWFVPEAGHRWVECKGEKGRCERWLIRDVPRDCQATEGSWTTPLRDARTLFRSLADLEPFEDAILEFANEHGWLLGPQLNEHVPLGPGPLVGGERFFVWLRSISAMHALVELLDAVVAEDSKTLADWITFKKSKAPEPATGNDLGVVCKIPSPPPIAIREQPFTVAVPPITPIARLLEPNNFVRAGEIVATIVINKQLEEHSSARVLFNPAREQWAPFLVPKNLWGALCLQYAEALRGDHHGFKRCSECGQWLGNRSDSRFCSDRCRARAYRKRKQEAKRLHDLGTRPSDIARKLRSDVQTVKGWLGVSGRRTQ